MGYRKRTGFLAGLTVAQISEFSLIFMAMGLALGHVDGESMGLVTLVGHDHDHVVHIHDPLLATALRLERTGARHLRTKSSAPGRGGGFRGIRARALRRDHRRDWPLGGALADRLEQHGLTVLGVDADPEAVRACAKRGRPVIYGDADDPGLCAELPLEHARWVVIAIPPHPLGLAHADPRRALLHALRSRGGTFKIGVIARDEQEAEDLTGLGADLVLQPVPDAAVRAIERITGEWEQV